MEFVISLISFKRISAYIAAIKLNPENNANRTNKGSEDRREVPRRNSMMKVRAVATHTRMDDMIVLLSVYVSRLYC